MKSAVKMGREEADMLVRMKSDYESLGISDPNFSTILVPSDQAVEMKRFGLNYSVEDTVAPKTVFPGLTVSIIPASGVPSSSPNHDAMVANQTAATIKKVDDANYTVSADSTALTKYASETGAGEAYWIGIAIATGKASIVGLEFAGKTLTAADVADATAVGLAAGSIAFYLNFGESSRNILMGDGTNSTVINFKVVDTAE